MSEKPLVEIDVGFFGKLPCRGDFVRRNLSEEFVDLWDGWLQSVILDGKAQDEAQWLDHYLTAPIWRFAIAPGIVDAACWCGALMPSVDRVNRYFPLTIAARFDDSQDVFELCHNNNDWFDFVEQRLLLALAQDDLDLDEYFESLKEVKPTSWFPELPSPELRQLHAERLDCLVEGEFDFQRDVGRIANSHLKLSLSPIAIFWSSGPVEQVTRLHLVKNLDNPESKFQWLFGEQT